MTQETPDQKTHEKKPDVVSVILSTLAAAIGIQSSKNRERDFAKGNLRSYIVSGIIFVALFITSIVMLVKFIIRSAGA